MTEDAHNRKEHLLSSETSADTNSNPSFPLGKAANWSDKNIQLMESGVTIRDPNTTQIEGEVEVGQDTIILPGCTLQGQTVIGTDCTIGPHTTIINSRIGNGATVKSSCWLENVTVGANITIEPFQRLIAPLS